MFTRGALSVASRRLGRMFRPDSATEVQCDEAVQRPVRAANGSARPGAVGGRPGPRSCGHSSRNRVPARSVAALTLNRAMYQDDLYNR